jgi:hypothetical protein
VASKIVIDTSQVNRVVKGLAGLEKQMPSAAVSAVNRTLDHVNTKVGRFVTAEYNISNKDVKATLTKHRAGRGRLRAWLKSQSRRLTFSHFRISSSKKAVKVKIKKASGFKKVNTDPGAFVQTLGGRKQIMKRIGKDRFPVQVMRSITVPQMVESLNVSDKIQTEANKKLSERIQHEMDFRLKKAGFK